MPSFGGLISGVLGSAAKGVGEVAERESVKNAQLDLRKQLAEAEDIMAQRVEERRRVAGITEEERKMSPTYINKQGAADLARSKLATQNQATLAPDIAAAKAVEYQALIDSGVPAKKAAIDAAEWASNAAKRLGERNEAIEAEKNKTKTFANDPNYIEGLSKISKASDASKITVASIQEQGRRDRLSLGSGGSDDKPETSITLERRSKAAKDALATQLGVPLNKVNEELAGLQEAADKGDENAKAKLARLQSSIAAVARTQQDLINYSGKRKPDNASAGPAKDRPPVTSFYSK